MYYVNVDASGKREETRLVEGRIRRVQVFASLRLVYSGASVSTAAHIVYQMLEMDCFGTSNLFLIFLLCLNPHALLFSLLYCVFVKTKDYQC